MIGFASFSSSASLVDGKVVSYDIEFRHAVKSAKTLHFLNTIDQSIHLYIDIDENDIPIAVTLVHPPAAVRYVEAQGEDDPELQKAALELFSFASKLVMWSQSFKSWSFDVRQLDPAQVMIRGATDRMRYLEPFTKAVAVA